MQLLARLCKAECISGKRFFSAHECCRAALSRSRNRAPHNAVAQGRKNGLAAGGRNTCKNALAQRRNVRERKRLSRQGSESDDRPRGLKRPGGSTGSAGDALRRK